MKKPPKSVPDAKIFEGLDPDDTPDQETTVKTIWAQVTAVQEVMSDAFPSHWDAFWYGTFSCLFTQMVAELGEKEAAKIVGKKGLKAFVERHDALLEQMFSACHRLDECDENCCCDEDEPGLPLTWQRKP
jgi:hypothetical protein